MPFASGIPMRRLELSKSIVSVLREDSDLLRALVEVHSTQGILTSSTVLMMTELTALFVGFVRFLGSPGSQHWFRGFFPGLIWPCSIRMTLEAGSFLSLKVSNIKSTYGFSNRGLFELTKSRLPPAPSSNIMLSTKQKFPEYVCGSLRACIVLIDSLGAICTCQLAKEKLFIDWYARNM
jgi:hypothetical protein